MDYHLIITENCSGIPEVDSSSLLINIPYNSNGWYTNVIFHTIAIHGTQLYNIFHTIAMHGTKLYNIFHTIAMHGTKLYNIFHSVEHFYAKQNILFKTNRTNVTNYGLSSYNYRKLFRHP
jgi:hypothetical protein